MDANDCPTMNHSDRNIVMTRYILGQLSEAERERLEDEYFRDSNLFEELVAAESDLIDSYVRGRLSGTDLQQFENYFLSTTERRDRVAFSKALLAGASAPSTSPARAPLPASPRFPVLFPVSRYALSGAFLLLVLAVIWFAVRDVRRSRELDQMRRSQAELQREVQQSHQKNAELQSELQQRPATPLQDSQVFAKANRPAIVLTLSDGLDRGPNAKPDVLTLSSDITSVVLLLETADGSSTSYNISLETPGGKSLLQKKGLSNWTTSEGRMVELQLPPTALPRGDYVLRLIGVAAGGQSEEVNAYSFHVVTH